MAKCWRVSTLSPLYHKKGKTQTFLALQTKFQHMGLSSILQWTGMFRWSCSNQDGWIEITPVLSALKLRQAPLLRNWSQKCLYHPGIQVNFAAAWLSLLAAEPRAGPYPDFISNKIFITHSSQVQNKPNVTDINVCCKIPTNIALQTS